MEKGFLTQSGADILDWDFVGKSMVTSGSARNLA